MDSVPFEMKQHSVSETLRQEVTPKIILEGESQAHEVILESNIEQGEDQVNDLKQNIYADLQKRVATDYDTFHRMITFNQKTNEQDQDYVVVQAQKVDKDSFTSSKSNRDEFGRTISGNVADLKNQVIDGAKLQDAQNISLDHESKLSKSISVSQASEINKRNSTKQTPQLKIDEEVEVDKEETPKSKIEGDNTISHKELENNNITSSSNTQRASTQLNLNEENNNIIIQDEEQFEKTVAMVNDYSINLVQNPISPQNRGPTSQSSRGHRDNRVQPYQYNSREQTTDSVNLPISGHETTSLYFSEQSLQESRQVLLDLLLSKNLGTELDKLNQASVRYVIDISLDILSQVAMRLRGHGDEQALTFRELMEGKLYIYKNLQEGVEIELIKSSDFIQRVSHLIKCINNGFDKLEDLDDNQVECLLLIFQSNQYQDMIMVVEVCHVLQLLGVSEFYPTQVQGVDLTQLDIKSFRIFNKMLHYFEKSQQIKGHDGLDLNRFMHDQVINQTIQIQNQQKQVELFHATYFFKRLKEAGIRKSDEIHMPIVVLLRIGAKYPELLMFKKLKRVLNYLQTNRYAKMLGHKKAKIEFTESSASHNSVGHSPTKQLNDFENPKSQDSSERLGNQKRQEFLSPTNLQNNSMPVQNDEDEQQRDDAYESLDGNRAQQDKIMSIGNVKSGMKVKHTEFSMNKGEYIVREPTQNSDEY